MKKLIALFPILSLLAFLSCSGMNEVAELPKAMIFSADVNGVAMIPSKSVSGISAGDVTFTFEFSTEIDIDKFDFTAIVFTGGELEASYGENHKILKLKPTESLAHFTRYVLSVLPVEQLGVNMVESYSYTIVTSYDPSDKFERISDEDLLTLVQEQTFKYF